MEATLEVLDDVNPLVIVDDDDVLLIEAAEVF